MTVKITRRRLLASASATAGAYALAGVPSLWAQSAAPIRLAAERRTLDINGRAASVFALRQPDNTMGVNLAPGERFVLELANRSGEPTIVHWHGQTPPAGQDGVAETSLASPVDTRRYDFVARPGTHWMHAHQGLQEQRLMAAPLIVRTADDTRMDAQEVVVLLHDFTFRDPAEILAELTKKAGISMDHAGMAGMTMHMPMSGHVMAPPKGAAAPTAGMAMDLNDIEFDAYLANDRTLADPLLVRTERSGRVRLRLINGATSTAFWVDLGTLDGTVVAVDGDPVVPVTVRRFPLAQAQRVDVVLQMPPDGGAFPILAQREGDRARTGIVLATPGATVAKLAEVADSAVGPVDLSLDMRLTAAQPLSRRPADVVHRLALTGSMMPYDWGIDGTTWAQHRPLAVAQGQRVELELVNQSRMAHPMHLHGHHFQVVAIGGAPTAGPMRDTVLVPVNGSVRIAFEADNPGRWLFHCHNLYHMATGMMTEVVYDGFA